MMCKQRKIVWAVLLLSAMVCIKSLIARDIMPIDKRIEITAKLGKKSTGKDLYQAAIWLANEKGSFIKTVFVTKCTGQEGLGNGYQKVFGITIVEHPSTLPVWAHACNAHYGKSVYPPKTNPLPDSISGATPKGEALKRTVTLSAAEIASLGDGRIAVFLEINITRDHTPSMVFKGTIGSEEGTPVTMTFVGYGDKKGKNGSIANAQAHKHSPSEYIKEVTIRMLPASS